MDVPLYEAVPGQAGGVLEDSADISMTRKLNIDNIRVFYLKELVVSHFVNNADVNPKLLDTLD